MLTTPHALVGLAIITKFPNLLGLFLSLLSHFFLDFFIPHWNPHLYTEFRQAKKISSFSLKVILIDSCVAVSLTLFFMARALPNLAQAFLLGFSALMAVFPDVLEIPYYFLGYKAKWMKTYVYFEHRHQSNGVFFWGVLTQILVILASLKILL
jgi:membrane-bound metal-dependent hydrolase YbcI (DUF457 family)